MDSRWEMGKYLSLLSIGAVFYTLAFPPYNWSGIAWVALTPLLFLLYTTSAQSAFFAGLLFGILWCVGVTNWLYFTVTNDFGLHFPLDLLFMLGNYTFFAGLPTGIVTLCSARLLQRGTPWQRTLGIPALWVSGEVLRANPWFGVSWGILGYTQHQHLLLIQIADVTSVYGVSFVLALGSYVAAEISRSCQLLQYKPLRVKVKSRRKVAPNQCSTDKNQNHSRTQGIEFQSPYSTNHNLRSVFVALGFLSIAVVVTLVYGSFCLRRYAVPPNTPPLRVAMVQGNIPPEQRWQPAYYASTLLKYASVTTQGITGSPPDLVIWPEFAINFYLDKEPLLALQLGQFAQMADTALLVGGPRVEETDSSTHYYNSAYLFSATGQLTGIYDKMRLVPFAEYSPFALPDVVSHSQEAPSLFTAGNDVTVFSLPKSTVGITICYEIAFPSVSRAIARKNAQVFVNISNDTWLGGAAAAVEHHFTMAILRAVENRRYLVRNATAGISGIIDPRGHVNQLYTAPEAVVRGEAFPMQEATIYTTYGDWFALTCLLVSISVLFLSSRTRNEKETESWEKRI